MREVTHPFVVEHIQVLEEYFKVERELFNLAFERPEGEFEENTYLVKLMELNHQMDKLSERLSETIVNLGQIKA